MMQTGLYTLAAGWLETLVPVVIAALWIIGSVAKAIQDQKKKGETRQPSVPEESAPSTGGQKSVEERLREIAEYRRRQMESGSGEASPRPTARAAQQEGERRHSDGSRVESQAERAAEERRIQEVRRREAERRMEARRRAQAAEAQREAEEHRRAEARRAVERQQFQEQERRRLAREAHAQQQAPTAMPVSARQPGDHETVHRHVPDADVPVNKPRQTAMKLTGLNRTGLRQVIVLKEVLDKPISMRDPWALPFEQ